MTRTVVNKYDGYRKQNRDIAVVYTIHRQAHLQAIPLRAMMNDLAEGETRTEAMSKLKVFKYLKYIPSNHPLFVSFEFPFGHPVSLEN